jgi:hypothetical protein
MSRTRFYLDPERYKALTEIARTENRSLSDLIHEMLDNQIGERKRLALETAAYALLPEYQKNPDMRAIQALDADDFYDWVENSSIKE